jgi:ankyrin repeat protein
MSAHSSPASPEEVLRRVVEAEDAEALRALLQGHSELLTRLDEPAFPFDTPAVVHFASREDPAMLGVLLEFGADPNRRSSWWAGGFHALQVASPRAADRLLRAGAVPDACAAAHLDRPDLLSRMIAAEPSAVHERGGDGQTPLHFARSRAVVDLLLEAGADPDARDVDHRSTPAQWMLAGRKGRGRYDLAAYLVERGASADVFLTAALGLTERARALVEADPGVLDLRTGQGDYGEKPPSSHHIYTWRIGPDLSPIQVARRFDHPDTRAALQAAATPRQRLLAALGEADADEVAALLRAHPDLLAHVRPEDQRMLADAGWAGDARAVELMLDLGFDPKARRPDGGTVLHGAAWEGASACVAAVLRHPAGRALVDDRDPTYRATPLGWCCHGSCHGAGPGKDHASVARLLLEAGARPDPDLGDVSAAVRAVIEGWRQSA